MLLDSHNVCMGTSVLHGLILCVSEGSPSEWMRTHSEDKETFDLHRLTLCVSEDWISLLLCIHIVNTVDFCGSYLILIVEVKKSMTACKFCIEIKLISIAEYLNRKSENRNEKHSITQNSCTFHPRNVMYYTCKGLLKVAKFPRSKLI